MATLSRPQTRTLTFWQKMTVGMSAFIVFGFAQFAMRGFVNYGQAPLVMHLHGFAMLAWLALLVSQSLLAGRGGLALHRRLGWASAVMVPLIVALAISVCVTTLGRGTVPPFFTPAYFLALVIISTLLFALLVAMAVRRRRQADWHKRLMVGSTVILLEPALGRVLPMPLIMPWGEWISMLIQLGVVWIIARHDQREMGHTHPATAAVAATVVLSHVSIELLALTPAWIGFVSQFAA